jgi:Flp pilus assembly protein CpaB
MSPGVLILGILAVLFALIGAHGAKKYLEDQAPVVEVAPPPEPELITVPMAVRDLDEGRTISVGDITTARLTQEQIAQMALPSSFMNRSSDVIGRTLCKSITRGQTFEPGSFYPDGVGPSVAHRLSSGQRAVTIPYEGSASEAGLVTPGAMVDVLFRTFAEPDKMVPETTVTLLENVEVLAVGRETYEGAVGGDETLLERNVTLQVTPAQARALMVVEDHGNVQLVLRNDPDVETVSDSGPSTLHELLGLQEVAPPFQTEIYRRGSLTTVIHGDGGPRLIQQTPYPMPIVESDTTLKAQEVSHTPRNNASANSRPSAGDTSCAGCGTSKDHSVVVSSGAAG